MCGRYALGVNPDELTELFDLVHAPAFEPRFNLAPSTLAPIVLHSSKRGGRSAESFAWGLVPHWAKDRTIGFRTFNARSETVRDKPAFRGSLAERRCLVPATGYYEWQKRDGAKQAWFAYDAAGRVLAFAGLWSRWRTELGRALHSFTILTRPAEGAQAAVHERMPVCLAPEAWDAWLRGPLEPAMRALEQRVALEQHPVSDAVSRPSSEGAHLSAPVALAAAAKRATQVAMPLDEFERTE